MHLTTRIAELQRKIDKEEAANRNSALLKQGFVLLSCDRVDQIQRAVLDYLKDRISEIDLLNVAATGLRQLFNVFRYLLQTLENGTILSNLYPVKKYAKQRKLTRPKTSALSSRQGRKSSFRSNKVKLAIINKLRSTPRIRINAKASATTYEPLKKKKSSLSSPSDDAISIESMELKVKCVGSVSSSTLVKNMDSSASVTTDDRIPESHRKRSSSIKHVGLRSSPTLIAPGSQPGETELRNRRITTIAETTEYHTEPSAVYLRTAGSMTVPTSRNYDESGKLSGKFASLDGFMIRATSIETEVSSEQPQLDTNVEYSPEYHLQSSAASVRRIIATTMKSREPKEFASNDAVMKKATNEAEMSSASSMKQDGTMKITLSTEPKTSVKESEPGANVEDSRHHTPPLIEPKMSSKEQEQVENVHKQASAVSVESHLSFTESEKPSAASTNQPRTVTRSTSIDSKIISPIDGNMSFKESEQVMKVVDIGYHKHSDASMKDDMDRSSQIERKMSFKEQVINVLKSPSFSTQQAAMVRRSTLIDRKMPFNKPEQVMRFEKDENKSVIPSRRKLSRASAFVPGEPIRMCSLVAEFEPIMMQDLRMALTSLKSIIDPENIKEKVRRANQSIQEENHPRLVSLDRKVTVFRISSFIRKSPRRTKSAETIGSRTSAASSSSLKKGRRSKRNSTRSKKKKSYPSSMSLNTIADSREIDMLPDTLPDNEDAWRDFCQQPSYKQLAEDYRKNEEILLENHDKYWKMLNNLVRLRDRVEALKTGIVKSNAVMDVTFATMPGSPDETSRRTSAEIRQARQKDLERLVAELKKSQEAVLQIQTDLNLHIRHRNSLTKAIMDDFDSYATMKYAIPLIYDMNLIEEELKKMTSEKKNILSSFKKPTPETDDLESILEKYRKLQAMEMERYNKLRASKKLAWKVN